MRSAANWLIFVMLCVVFVVSVTMGGVGYADSQPFAVKGSASPGIDERVNVSAFQKGPVAVTRNANTWEFRIASENENGALEIAIHSVDGARLASLKPARCAQGYLARWDGRGAHGKPLAQGLYLLRVSSERNYLKKIVVY